MGLTTLPVYLDSNAVIDFIEQQHERLRLLFASADRGEIELVTSELTLAEVLVRPLQRKEGWLLQLYENVLIKDRVVRMIPIDLDILRRSAEMRAASGGSTPDSLHVATALSNDCRYVVSSDKRLRTPADVRRVAAADIDADLIKSWA